MFDESNLHSLIARESEQRNIPFGKLLRESLNAAADDKFAVRAAAGLSPNWREELRQLAAVAEVQNDWGWWHKPPWSVLKLLLVKEADYLAWLDSAGGATPRSTTNSHPGKTTDTHRSRPARELAAKALKALYGNCIPGRSGKTDQQLCGEVQAWLADDRNWSTAETKRSVSCDTILREAGRRTD